MSLSREQNDLGVFWGCPSCRGRAVTVALLRKGLTREAVNALWLAARSPSAPRRRECPACLTPMAEVCLPAALSAQTIDVCTRCQTVWFDTHEYERMPAAPPPPKTFVQSLPPEARERYAMMVMQEMQERHAEESQTPNETWQFIPAMLGLPFERTSRVKSQAPLLTWGLAMAIAAVSVTALLAGEDAIQRFALVPARLAESGGLTLITAVFLHGGWLHLLSNLYFLVVFGDDVEDLLGKTRYALLLLLAALAGGLAHTLWDPRATVPCVGASGVISAIITYYALALPHARLGFLLRVYWRVKWVNLSARNMFLLWFAMQLLGIWKQVSGFGSVSALAHVGGVAVGALFWGAGRWRDSKRP
ncbi:MAG: rhomboid family intramembrane serine protease [Kiritimatiellaeota bacterium]|nr:rhomboid family intramembrane serine protease [Kiritimatiellota bacterium]